MSTKIPPLYFGPNIVNNIKARLLRPPDPSPAHSRWLGSVAAYQGTYF